METDDTACVFGEDVGFGGVFIHRTLLSRVLRRREKERWEDAIIIMTTPTIETIETTRARSIWRERSAFVFVRRELYKSRSALLEC